MEVFSGLVRSSLVLWCTDNALMESWWCMGVIFDILETSAFQKHSTCWVFSEFCLCLCLCVCHCLCLCLCLEVDSGPRHEQGKSQHRYINIGNLNLYTLTHYSWKLFCLCHCICLCLCICHHRLIEYTVLFAAIFHMRGLAWSWDDL